MLFVKCAFQAREFSLTLNELHALRALWEYFHNGNKVANSRAVGAIHEKFIFQFTQGTALLFIV